METERGKRVLRSSKTLPGLRTIISAVFKSVKNLRDAIILAIFTLCMFAVFGLQIYMGMLTQKCIKKFPTDGSWGDPTNENWHKFMFNSTNWYTENGHYELCGNSTGARLCKEGYVCIQGYGPNPDYGYTNFDTFGWSFLGAFRLMTQDYWENLYEMILQTAGPWHILFFIITIFFGSYYIVNLILAIVAISYDELQKKSEEEKETEEEAIRRSSPERMTPNCRRNGGTLGGDRKPLELLSTYLDAQEHIPYVDESNAVTPMTEATEALAMYFGKKTKQDQQLTERLDNEPQNELDSSSAGLLDNPFVDNAEKQSTIDMKDAMVLNDIAEQSAAAQRRVSNDKGTAMKIIDTCCVWDCCGPWIKLQKLLQKIVTDPFFGLFIMFCIIANTICMALDHHDMNIDMDRFLRNGNYFFVLVFTVEAILKIIAFSPKYYFQSNWNRFDFSIVVLSLVELGLEGVQGLSVFRAFRLLRVFRLAKSWPTMSLLISIMGKTMGPLGNLTFILMIIVFIFAYVGMKLFGRHYIDNRDRFYDSNIPRWNFTDFLHSFMTVFRALCGEWIETMWDCTLVAGESCIPYFIATFVIGNLVVLNLFLALMLSHFGSSDLSTSDQEPNEVGEAFNRIGRLILWIKSSMKIVGFKLSEQTSGEELAGTHKQKSFKDGEEDEFEDEECDCEATPLDEELTTNVNENDEKPANCFPENCYKICPFLADSKGWDNLRLKALHLAENNYFEAAMITIILIGNLAMALEDDTLKERQVLQDIVHSIDLIVTVVFVIEMLIKWLALGFKKYFTDAWCWFDFIIVMVSLINVTLLLCGAGKSPVLKTFKSLRALRPLRAMSKTQGSRVVINALMQAIPAIFSVLLVCLIFWLIFAIMGVQLFAGKFYKCVDENGETLSHEVVPDRLTCEEKNYTWENSIMNFDHVGNAYLCLFEIATFKGWINIMSDATDSREVHMQPIRETNIYMNLYFVIFIIFGSFFILNLFVGVIIDKFTDQKKKAAGSLDTFMTEEQKQYYNAMKSIGLKKPRKAIPKPTWRAQAIVFDFVTNKKFEMFIMFIIGLNMLTMALDYYNATDKYIVVLDYLNLIFIVIYTVEALLKLFGLRHHYFKDPWNVFDFLVVVFSIIGLLVSDLVEEYFVSPTLLRLMRLMRIGRVVRFMKSAKGIRTLLFALSKSMPALINIVLMLFLVTFIYALFGMTFFMDIQHNAAIDDTINFETFGRSMFLLFPITTAAGWDGVLHALINEEDCVPPDPSTGSPGNCGHSAIGIAYMLSYLVLTFLIITNMYIAVIIENYAQATENVNESLTDDDYDMFYEVWQKFDPDATQHIRYDQLTDFLESLESPLQIQNLTKYKIASMDIPIRKGDLLFCVDILDAVTKEFFARKGNPVNEIAELGEVQFENLDKVGEPISSTLWRQREDYCAKVIQTAWKK